MATTSNPPVERQPAADNAEKNPLPLAGSQSQRLETVGRLTSGVAHDFANLLTLIAGYSELMLDRIGEKDALRQHLEEISNAASRGARLTSQLLGFTRGRTGEPQALDLNEMATESLRLLGPVIGEHMRIETLLAAGSGKILADRSQLEQVLMNLVLNARDAMPRGGTIRIETALAEWPEEEAQRHNVEPGPKVLLAVSDTGHGMDEQTLARAFDPFFTTKEHGKGTGLGLNTVKTIVRQNGGDVWARSVPGEGSTFTICLPRAAQTPGAAGSGDGLHAPGSGGETVLLVEDEDPVRKLIGHVLRRRGYQVIEAASAEDALRIFGERGAEIQLVLTDMVMPGKSGRELAEALCEKRPDIRLIFMSGYTDDVLQRTGALRPGMSFLQKPLRPETLAARVREALDSPVRPFNRQ
ncbi:MAG TPA: ATP-binding protein [Bryobacteraceae bacterium]|nr:ATP-binding protein [Bryobacteraceae bacterium]